MTVTRRSLQDDDLLRPAEVAEMFGVRTPTIARWAREGRLVPLLTPGGHRRYTRQEILRALGTPEQTAHDQLAADAVRLYEQGWNIRQVADRFDVTYGVMRRLLTKHTTLRDRSGRMLRPAPANDDPSTAEERS